LLALDKQIWWQAPNAVRIPLAIVLAIAWTFRLRRVYFGIKNTPKRSPRVRHIEIVTVTVLWSFIALGVTFLLLTKH
jgi:hypothetical protein